MKIKNQNKEMEDIGLLLVHEHKSNVYGGFLNYKNLDYSLRSLKIVDDYLEKIRKKKSELIDRDIKKIILRCGAYLGEVIREIDSKNIIWISYDQACKISKDIKERIVRDITTHVILYDKKKKKFWFPLAKVYKFLEYGRADNLWSFAKVMIEDYKKQK